MAIMGYIVGSEDGYTLWEGVSGGRDAWMVQHTDGDGKPFVSRTYKTRADAERGWRRWRQTGRDDTVARALVEAMAAKKENAA